jgi:phage terminase large subunit GpA-like protein
MICKSDNKKVFEDPQDYTILCEACQLHCKLYHYRQCQARFEWNAENGNDILKQIAQSNKLAQSQTGLKIDPVNGIPAYETDQTKITARERKLQRRDKRRGR